MTIPNILTFFRLLSSLALGVPLVIFSDPKIAAWVTFFIFILGAVTDFFDGFLARKLNQTSKLGQILDPVADKITVIIMLMVIIGFTYGQLEIIIPASFIVFREILVSGMREFLGDKAGALAVTEFAKWKTTTQMFSLGMMILAVALDIDLIFMVGYGVFLLSVLLTVLTGLDYARKAIVLMREDTPK